MPTSYSDPSNKITLRQPLFKRIRSYYRGPRKSYAENLANAKMYIDIQRIYMELEKVDISILNKLKIILDKEKDNNFTVKLSDGSRVFNFNSDELNGIQFNVQWKDAGSHTQVTSSPTMDTISSRLAKIQMKVNRLES